MTDRPRRGKRTQRIPRTEDLPQQQRGRARRRRILLQMMQTRVIIPTTTRRRGRKQAEREFEGPPLPSCRRTAPSRRALLPADPRLGYSCVTFRCDRCRGKKTRRVLSRLLCRYLDLSLVRLRDADSFVPRHLPFASLSLRLRFLLTSNRCDILPESDPPLCNHCRNVSPRR